MPTTLLPGAVGDAKTMEMVAQPARGLGSMSIQPITGGNIFQPPSEEMEALSQILKTLNGL